jgi:hypothetical protein
MNSLPETVSDIDYLLSLPTEELAALLEIESIQGFLSDKVC